MLPLTVEVPSFITFAFFFLFFHMLVLYHLGFALLCLVLGRALLHLPHLRLALQPSLASPPSVNITPLIFTFLFVCFILVAEWFYPDLSDTIILPRNGFLVKRSFFDRYLFS